MAERLAKLFSSPKFKESRAHTTQKSFENVSQLLSTTRYDTAQDELSLEMDARSDGFTSRICDTANSLLLGEFPWGSEKRHDYVTIKQRRIPKPVPVRLRIGPPNSSALINSDSDPGGYENEESNSSKSLIHALRALSRKRTHSFMNEGEVDNDDLDGNATASKLRKPIEHRHNLYLSQLEEDTPEYKNGLKIQSDHLECVKRLREDDGTNSNNSMVIPTSPDGILSKRQRLRSPDNVGSGIPCNGTPITNGNSSQTNITPRRGCNEIISSLSSSLSMVNNKFLKEVVKPKVPKQRHMKHKKVVAVETQTQTIQPVVEVSTEARPVESPKKEDKCINTDPVKPVIIEEKVVTDKMANALMKSAVSKFLATEDPTLSPIRNFPVQNTPSTPPTKETLLPTAVTSANSLIQPPGFTGNVPFSVPSTIEKPSWSLPFGPSAVSTTSLSIPNTTTTNSAPPFSLGSPTVDNKTTTATSTFVISSPFTSVTTTQATTNSVTLSKSTESPKQISFGDNKLGGGFKLPEAKLDLKDDKSCKTSETVAPNIFSSVTSTPSIGSTTPNLFGQVTSAPSTATSTNTVAPNLFGQLTSTPSSVSTTNAVSSESSKPTFSFPFSSSSSPSPATTSGDPIKTPTFTFGTSNTNVIKPTATPSSSTTTETTKVTSQPPKLSIFGTATTTKPSQSFQMSAEIVNTTANSSTTNTGGFSFGGSNTVINKTEDAKPTQSKPEGLFSFGATGTSSITKTENKPFSFGGTPSNTTDTTKQAQQQAKPVFQFGSSSFGTSQPNKEGFSFGAKPADPAPTVGFGSYNLFGAKTSSSGLSTSSTTASTTSSGLFGFGAVQPPAITVTPAFGSVTSTTNSNISGFQANKPQDKPSSGVFPFKFTGGNSAPTAEAPKPSFTFGASATQNPTPAFGSTSITSQPPFGNVAPATGSSTFPAFGSTSTFGSAPAANSPAPAFGSSTTANPAPAFGSSTAASPAPPFGSATTANPNPAPVFGSSTTATPTPAPAFGSSTPAPAFGSSAATQPAQPLFGSMQTQPTAGPSFTFGASSTPASSGGFNFGSPAQPPAQPSSSGLFQFGSSAAQQNPAGGVQPFQFGASTSTSTPVGGQPMFSIGSGSTAPRSRQPLSRRKK